MMRVILTVEFEAEVPEGTDLDGLCLSTPDFSSLVLEDAHRGPLSEYEILNHVTIRAQEITNPN